MSITRVNGPETSGSPLVFIERATVTATAASAPSATPRVKANESRSPDAPPPTAAAVTDAIKQINRVVREAGQNIEFSVDDDSGRTVVKVVDTETNKVLRQLPSEAAMAIAKGLDSVKGMLINSKA